MKNKIPDLFKQDHTGTIIIKDGKRINPEDFYINNTMNIQTIIDKFDEKFVKDLGNEVEPIFIDAVGSVGPIRKFLKDSLTSMLDGIRKEAIEQSTGGSDRYEIPYITMSNLLNIINSHR